MLLPPIEHQKTMPMRMSLKGDVLMKTFEKVHVLRIKQMFYKCTLTLENR